MENGFPVGMDAHREFFWCLPRTATYVILVRVFGGFCFA
jgi:hypothetical protein